jgi:hypothetical protein
MKRTPLFITLFLAIVSTSAFAQVKRYSSNGMESIFSFSEYTAAGNNVSNKLRYSAFFHVNHRRHLDLGKSFGLFTGFAIRNVGFIARESDSLTVKRRVYTAGVPLAFKIGNMEKMKFLYLGAEAELAFNYKEKHFVDGSKEKKFNEWFSQRTPLFMPSVFAGIQNKRGFNVYVKYYLTNFFNTGFKEKGIQPNSQREANMFYISVSYSRKNRKSARTGDKKLPPVNPVTRAY